MHILMIMIALICFLQQSKKKKDWIMIYTCFSKSYNYINHKNNKLGIQAHKVKLSNVLSKECV